MIYQKIIIIAGMLVLSRFQGLAQQDSKSNNQNIPQRTSTNSEIKSGAKEGWSGVKKTGRSIGKQTKKVVKSVGKETKNSVKEIKKDLKN